MKQLAAIVFLLAVIFTSCTDARSAKSDVRSFVEDHQTQLEQSIDDGTASDWEGTAAIEHVYIRENVIGFSCGASGWGSETAYWGFFWSAENDPFSYWSLAEPEDFAPEGEGFSWTQPDGDNTLYVEHICGSFYYYEETY